MLSAAQALPFRHHFTLNLGTACSVDGDVETSQRACLIALTLKMTPLSGLRKYAVKMRRLELSGSARNLVCSYAPLIHSNLSYTGSAFYERQICSTTYTCPLNIADQHYTWRTTSRLFSCGIYYTFFSVNK